MQMDGCVLTTISSHFPSNCSLNSFTTSLWLYNMDIIHITGYCRHRKLRGNSYSRRTKSCFSYHISAESVTGSQFTISGAVCKKKRVSKSVIAEQHPQLMQNNADRPKIRVHHKRKFREITSLPTISIHNLEKSLLIFRRIYKMIT